MKRKKNLLQNTIKSALAIGVVASLSHTVLIDEKKEYSKPDDLPTNIYRLDTSILRSDSAVSRATGTISDYRNAILTGQEREDETF
ncbi:MAG: hypothetical protein A2Z42_01955 [Candidatus Woykebacteria bacterium RBG_19FT_COMBO_43_10]|uniref:Uncharacterized protein n=1 Tax=Candidatus Woykebacteria bacterium RBG_19FT_COMBO_43_10 TaxID=1802598 RepID=A0A1G1WIX9_9BACT|nr:MAG: hypothetical protein A2Z42_01955 [Candidatus Woykebacteria bacterium RBG_19FT_COMBO_43_10]